MRYLRSQRGVIIIGAFIVTFFFLVTSLAVAEFGMSHYTSTRRTLIAADSMDGAEAGADAFMYQINQSSTYQGTTNAPSSATDSCTGYTSTPVTLVNNSTQGKITYESCVQNGTLSNEKLVTVTANTYLPATASSPTLTRKLRLVIQSSSSGAGYTVQTGNGGLTMSNTASLGAGDFYINGRLLMSNSATIGDATHAKASHLWVAGSGCGSGSSYPQVCSGATGQNDLPIYLSNSAHIYADVHAPNMTGGGFDGNATRNAMTNSGLVDGTAPVVSMPDDNRATVMGRNSWTTRSASTASCSSGSVTWAGGTHFTGSSTINISNKCKVTVTGDIWIDGGLILSNSGSILVGSSATTQPNILIDGQTGFQPSNSSSLQANADGLAIRVNTYWSAAGSCSTTCPTPTGSALQTSQNTVTIQTSNTFTAPGATLYAVYSQLRVSNATNVGQLIAQQINLANSGTITFSGGASDGGGPVTWSVTHYQQLY